MGQKSRDRAQWAYDFNQYEEICILKTIFCTPIEIYGTQFEVEFRSFYCIFLCQALYFCVPFREKLLKYYEKNKNPADPEENLLTCLADLFTQVCDLKTMMIYFFDTHCPVIFQAGLLLL